jgi:hypothetical protein
MTRHSIETAAADVKAEADFEAATRVVERHLLTDDFRPSWRLSCLDNRDAKATK